MKKLVQNLIRFFESNLGKQSINYFIFYALTWSFHLILISVISYFHLILNHSIGTISDWIIDRGWMIIIITKLVIFAIVIQFMKLRTKNYVHIRGLLRNSISWPRHEAYVLIGFLLLTVISIGNVKYNSSLIFNLSRLIVSAVGILVFFGIDLFYILILDVFNPLNSEKEIKRKTLLFAFYFYFLGQMTFIYEQMNAFYMFSFFYLLLYLAYWRRRNWTLPILLILAFIIPVFVIFGFDPIWGSTFSLFMPLKKISSFVFLILVAFVFFYLEWRKQKYPEYIYRD